MALIDDKASKELISRGEMKMDEEKTPHDHNWEVSEDDDYQLEFEEEPEEKEVEKKEVEKWKNSRCPKPCCNCIKQ